MFVYERSPFYYETDQMKIVHHSNYIRWYEEARIHFLEAIDYPLSWFEEQGYTCPVLAVTSEYKKMVRFGDTLAIRTRLVEYDGLRLAFAYEIYNFTKDEVAAIGTSSHCFLNPKGMPMRLKRHYPEIHAAFLAARES